MRLSRISSRRAWVAGLGLLTSVWLAGAPVAYAATASATATATVWAALTITKSADLSFGILSASATAGTVVVDPAGVRSATGGVTLQGGTVTAASFTLTGQANATYTITLPSSITIGDGGTNTMTVDTFTSNPTPTGTLDAAGNGTLTVGATLHVAANQAAATYTGTFNVTVDYQ